MSTMNEIIIANAKKYLGKPYVWGGESDAEGGYDCSGYVYNVLNDSGIKVPRDTAQGYYNRFKANKSNKVVAGALLCFGTTSKIKHIGIASGDGIHMYESKGSSKNTKSNPGKGVVYSYISRRKDLVAVVLPFTPAKKIPKLAYCYPNLKEGSKGTNVKLLQMDLNYVIDSNLATDGRFGPLTKKALMNFQKKYNLTVDGVYGRHSFNMMKGLLL